MRYVVRVTPLERKLTTKIYLGPRLKRNGTIPLLPACLHSMERGKLSVAFYKYLVQVAAYVELTCLSSYNMKDIEKF
jgi:hypothetical protein